MADFDNTNRGTLFENDKAGNPNRPDYTGKININGTEYRLSAWWRDGKTGKFLSLSVSESKPKADPEPAQEIPQVADEIPFN